MLKPKHSARRQLLATRAWQNRRCPSEPEQRLWRELAGGRLGVTFRRQVVQGNFITDFLVAPQVSD